MVRAKLRDARFSIGTEPPSIPRPPGYDRCHTHKSNRPSWMRAFRGPARGGQPAPSTVAADPSPIPPLAGSPHGRPTQAFKAAAMAAVS